MPIALQPRSVLRTHTVENQPLPLGARNAYRCNAALQEAAEREGAAWARCPSCGMPWRCMAPPAVASGGGFDAAEYAYKNSKAFGEAVRNAVVGDFTCVWHRFAGATAGLATNLPDGQSAARRRLSAANRRSRHPEVGLGNISSAKSTKARTLGVR